MFGIFKAKRRYLLTKHGKGATHIWATSVEVVNGSLVAKIGNRTTAVLGPGTWDGVYDLSCKDNKWYMEPEERPAPPPPPPPPPVRHPSKPHFGANPPSAHLDQADDGHRDWVNKQTRPDEPDAPR